MLKELVQVEDVIITEKPFSNENTKEKAFTYPDYLRIEAILNSENITQSDIKEIKTLLLPDLYEKTSEEFYNYVSDRLIMLMYLMGNEE